MEFQYVIIILISVFSTLAGSICGIGGGIIIKPVLDSMQIMSVASIGFLSGITVLTMSLYSVGKAFAAKESKVKFKIGLPLSIGAIIGGMIGRQLFHYIQGLNSDMNKIGAYQSLILFVLTFGTLLYTWKKSSITTKNYSSKLICILIGLTLGLMSAFLGIGGGPFNLIFLSYFFSMDTKESAQNSLFIIMFSQLSSLLLTLSTGELPSFTFPLLLYMILSALLGAAMGRYFNKKIDNATVDKLFISIIVIILFICIRNFSLYI